MTIVKVAPVSPKLQRVSNGADLGGSNIEDPGSSILYLASRSAALCLCGFNVNEIVHLWTFQSLIGYC